MLHVYTLTPAYPGEVGDKKLVTHLARLAYVVHTPRSREFLYKSIASLRAASFY